MSLRVLVVGGYGSFGGRLVELLEGEAGLTLLVAGRSLASAEAFCRRRGTPSAELIPTRFNRDGDLDAEIAVLRPDILVDASGPFQAYGEDRYRVVEACLRGGVNYLDLADGSDFVLGIGAFDAAARAAGTYVLSGVSTCPALTAAVARRLSAGMARVDAICGGIAPSPHAGIGRSVIRAIAGYAGQPVAMIRDGRPATGHPFTESRRFAIAPPGHLPLGSRIFSLVDVPDLRALAQLWPEAKTIWFGAGPAPAILHRVLIAMARLVRAGWIRTLSPLAPLMHRAMARLAWGEHRGGMFVEVEGADASGEPVRRSWHLVAEGDDGPFIPAMPAAALVRRVLTGCPPPLGARAALREVELEDYERFFTNRRILAGCRDGAPSPLYPGALGSAWARLPAELRAMHEIRGRAVAEGRATVEGGSGLVARLMAAVIGFPRAAADTPVQVTFEVADGQENWTRRFGGESFSSCQFAGSDGLICEGFGPLVFGMAAIVEGVRLRLVLRRWSAFGIPLPLWACPRMEAHETVEEGRFRFHVELSHPIAGLIVRYRGWLIPSHFLT
ncbi:MAG: hypothetical protein JWR00_4777 [Rubritepida sp.]|nr:hypothetical protein [Rubritepida sp.]